MCAGHPCIFSSRFSLQTEFSILCETWSADFIYQIFRSDQRPRTNLSPNQVKVTEKQDGQDKCDLRNNTFIPETEAKGSMWSKKAETYKRQLLMLPGGGELNWRELKEVHDCWRSEAHKKKTKRKHKHQHVYRSISKAGTDLQMQILAPLQETSKQVLKNHAAWW